MDWTRIKTTVSTINFYTQRIIAGIATIFSASMALLMFLPAIGADNTDEAWTWIIKSGGCVLVSLLFATIYWYVMKARYPNYPNR